MEKFAKYSYLVFSALFFIFYFIEKSQLAAMDELTIEFAKQAVKMICSLIFAFSWLIVYHVKEGHDMIQ